MKSDDDEDRLDTPSSFEHLQHDETKDPPSSVRAFRTLFSVEMGESYPFLLILV